jgi:DNA-binding XRE family transcriptional regulator
MTQAALGQLTHIGRTSLANIERGWQHPPLHVLCALAAVLRIPLESLIAATPTVTRIDGPWHMHGHSWDHTS